MNADVCVMLGCLMLSVYSKLFCSSFADESSVLSSLGGNNTVNNNAGDGFLIEDLSIAHFFAKDTATGNGRFSLQCDDTSLVEGDTSSLTHIRCGRFHARGWGQHGNQH